MCSDCEETMQSLDVRRLEEKLAERKAARR
jgi:hypothetical protein